VRKAATGALVRSVDPQELMRALGCAIALLLDEAVEHQELVNKVRPHLQQPTEAMIR